MMTLTRFTALCAAYGGDMDRWPAAERDAGRALAAASRDAAAALMEARALDAVLTRAPTEAASDALVRRIAAGAPLPSPVRAPGPSWAAMAAALALTIGLGAGWVGAGTGAAGDTDLYADAFGALEDDAVLELLEDA